MAADKKQAVSAINGTPPFFFEIWGKHSSSEFVQPQQEVELFIDVFRADDGLQEALGFLEAVADRVRMLVERGGG